MNNKERFTDRVDAYRRYRPGYPDALFDFLYGTLGFSPDARIADVGAGTGIFSGALLERGSRVVAVEPNGAMREVAAEEWGGHSRFRVAEGSAEATGLDSGEVDFVVCAQSFHWFDRAAAREEFRRIARPGGLTVLVWNMRDDKGSPFMNEYEDTLRRYGTDYAQVAAAKLTHAELADFYRSGPMGERRFRHSQPFDFDGLAGRALSSSYAPLPGHANYEPMMKELRELFGRYEREGKVSFDYVTEAYWGEP